MAESDVLPSEEKDHVVYVAFTHKTLASFLKALNTAKVHPGPDTYYQFEYVTSDKQARFEAGFIYVFEVYDESKNPNYRPPPGPPPPDEWSWM